MAKAATKFVIYFIAIVGIHYYAVSVASGNCDPTYRRFTTGKHESMILGSSRAAQGLVPDVFNNHLSEDYTRLNNFAFTISGSPYGEIYLRAIKRKLDKSCGEQNNYFILEVMPWTISTRKFESGEIQFTEKDSYLDLVKSVDHFYEPNFEFFLKYYPEGWGKLLIREFRGYNAWYLHEDGWLEVNVPMDEKSVFLRKEKKVTDYRNDKLRFYNFSKFRFEKLKETIEFLKDYGEVYLVRLPISEEIRAIEEQHMPEFDEIMCKLSIAEKVRYWNFSKDSGYIFTDGNHLAATSSKSISERISKYILEQASGSCY